MRGLDEGAFRGGVVASAGGLSVGGLAARMIWYTVAPKAGASVAMPAAAQPIIAIDRLQANTVSVTQRATME